MNPTFTISTDQSKLDIDVIHRFLTNSYWCAGISKGAVAKSIRHSLCFGVYAHADGTDRQVGFARVVTDYATFAYLADVFVLDEYRGNGLSRMLMQTIVTHPELQGLRRWVLATRDAHGLYEKFGFTPLAKPERFMELHTPEVYRSSL